MKSIKIPKFLQPWIAPKTKPDPMHWYQTLGLFILYYLGEQLVPTILQLSYLSRQTSAHIIGLIIALLVAMMIVKHIDRYQTIHDQVIHQFNFKKTAKMIGQMFLGFFAMLFINTTVQAIVDTLTKNHVKNSVNQQTLQAGLTDPITIIYTVIFVIIFAPRIEEFYFRFLLIKDKKHHQNQWVTTLRLLWTSLVFALAHMLNPGQIELLIDHKTSIIEFAITTLPYFSMGLSLGLIYVWFSRYRLNFLIHGTWNAFAVSVMLATLMTHH